MTIVRRTALTSLVALSFAVPSAQAQEADHSPGQAFTVSLLATAAPIAAGLLQNKDGLRYGLISAGIMIGPAAGYWTGGAAGRGWKGIGFRGILVGATAAAVYGICNIDRCDIFEDEEDATVVALVVTLLGAGAIAASTVIDIVEAPAHVRAANEARRASGVTLSLAPLILPSDGGTLGISGTLRF
jgi:hypothetical protein